MKKNCVKEMQMGTMKKMKSMQWINATILGTMKKMKSVQWINATIGTNEKQM